MAKSKLEIRNELEKLIKTYFSPKCGWEDYKDCPEHSSCEDAKNIVKMLDDLCAYENEEARAIDYSNLLMKELDAKCDRIVRETVFIREDLIGAKDIWNCPRCGREVMRPEISIHVVDNIDPSWNTGFEFCGGCPHCDIERRKEARKNGTP